MSVRHTKTCHDVSRTLTTISRLCPSTRQPIIVRISPNRCHRQIRVRQPRIALINRATSDIHVIKNLNTGVPSDSNSNISNALNAFEACAILISTSSIQLRGLAVIGSTNSNHRIKRTVTLCTSNSHLIISTYYVAKHRSALFLNPLPPHRIGPNKFVKPGRFTPHQINHRCFQHYQVRNSISFVFNNTHTCFRKYRVQSLGHSVSIGNCIATTSAPRKRPCNFIFRNYSFATSRSITPSSICLNHP